MNNLYLKILYDEIKEYPDFPIKGVLFKDCLPLITDSSLRQVLINELRRTIPPDVTCIVAPESRGFLLGVLVAQELKLKFIPIRKPGKLPGEVRTKSYDTEYSTDTLEMQSGILNEFDICWFIDDVYATGGTYKAVESLVNTEAKLKGGTILLDVLGNKEENIIELFRGDTND